MKVLGWQEDVKVAIKKCTVEGAKKMSKNSTNRAPTRKAVSHKQTVKGSRPTASKKKRVSANILQMNMNNQEERSFSDLELFKRPAVQNHVLNGKFVKIYPITKLEDSGPIRFLIENVTDHFLGFRQSYLNIKLKVVNSDGSYLVADAKAVLVKYPIDSLFQQVDVLLNGNLISSSTSTYAYRVMLEVLLGYDQEAKDSYRTMGLCGKGTTTKMEWVAVDGANGGLIARTRNIKERKLVEVSGLLHCDLDNLDHLLLNGLPLMIVFHRQRHSFVLTTDDASRDSRVCIIEAQLCVRHVKLSDDKYSIIQQSLPAPIKYVIMKTHFLAKEISSLNWKNAHVGQLPSRVFMAMVMVNPFNFKQFNAS